MQPPNSVVPTALRAPNGSLVYSDAEKAPRQGTRLPGYYGGYTPWTGSFTLPATERLLDFAMSRGDLPAGTWSFQVNDWNAECQAIAGCSPGVAGSYDVTVVNKPGPYLASGRLDLAVYLVGTGTDAAAAAASAPYRRFVKGIRSLLGQAGVCLGAVTFHDVAAWAQTAFSTTRIYIPAPCPAAADLRANQPPCGDDLAQLFSLARRDVDGAHLFLVQNLAVVCGKDVDPSYKCNIGGSIVGIDGSIPGPSGIPGATTSGAAMSGAENHE